MYEPMRLVEGQNGDLEAALLRAVRSERPPPGSHERALKGLARWAPAVVVGFWARQLLGHTGSWLTAVTGTAVVAGGVALTVGLIRDASPHRVGGSRPALSTISTVDAIPAPGVERAVLPPRPSAAPAIVPSSTPVRRERTTPAERPRTQTVDPRDREPLVAPAETRHAAGDDFGGRPSQGALPSLSRRHLAAEVAALDEARRALEGQEPQLALRLLAAYERRFPAGSLAAEAQVLRVRALREAGDPAGATALGRALLEAHPNGPHAHQIESILAGSKP